MAVIHTSLCAAVKTQLDGIWGALDRELGALNAPACPTLIWSVTLSMSLPSRSLDFPFCRGKGRVTQCATQVIIFQIHLPLASSLNCYHGPAGVPKPSLATPATPTGHRQEDGGVWHGKPWWAQHGLGSEPPASCVTGHLELPVGASVSFSVKCRQCSLSTRSNEKFRGNRHQMPNRVN